MGADEGNDIFFFFRFPFGVGVVFAENIGKDCFDKGAGWLFVHSEFFEVWGVSCR